MKNNKAISFLPWLIGQEGDSYDGVPLMTAAHFFNQPFDVEMLADIKTIGEDDDEFKARMKIHKKKLFKRWIVNRYNKGWGILGQPIKEIEFVIPLGKDDAAESLEFIWCGNSSEPFKEGYPLYKIIYTNRDRKINKTLTHPDTLNDFITICNIYDVDLHWRCKLKNLIWPK